MNVVRQAVFRSDWLTANRLGQTFQHSKRGQTFQHSKQNDFNAPIYGTTESRPGRSGASESRKLEYLTEKTHSKRPNTVVDGPVNNAERVRKHSEKVQTERVVAYWNL
jgi:hypothetical protein